jgi:hypothetical protein
MPETQIRRPDGTNTTVPELLQELAAKEAAESSPHTGKTEQHPRQVVDTKFGEKALRHTGRQ